jgi:low affinity Fe/Cu permease
MSKSKERAKSLAKALVQRLREKFEKFVNSHDPSIVIIMSVAVIIWSAAALIVVFSMLFGFWDIIGSDAWYIVITSFLPFVLIAFITLVQTIFIAIATGIEKLFTKFEERVKRYSESQRAEKRESHFMKVAKKISDDTLELILKRSQIFSISIYLQFAACLMLGLIALKEPYDGNVQKALIRFSVPIATYVIGLILFCIYQYFDNVNLAKSRLKKLDNHNTEGE